MTRTGTSISIWLSILACAPACRGTRVEADGDDAVASGVSGLVGKGVEFPGLPRQLRSPDAVASTMTILANSTGLSAETITAELLLPPRQPLSKGTIEFSIALRNHSKRKIVFWARPFLDAMRISLKHKSDLSLSLPQNLRFRINATVLPPRPYTVSGWRVTTKSLDGTAVTSELPSAILRTNDPKMLQKARIEMPASSTLVVDFVVATLVRTTRVQQDVSIEKVGIAEGEYALEISMLLFFSRDESSRKYMRFGLKNPATLSICKDVGREHE